MRRGSSGLSLLIGIDKPEGATSHDIVNSTRRIFDEKRVGHAGTLDPLATGVLPILVGPATRLSDYLMGHDKAYTATIRFGAGTTTDDSCGTVIRTADIPAALLDEAFARSFLFTLIGQHDQLPPSYSAIKVNGKRAYSEARRGNVIDLMPRRIEIFAADLVRIDTAGFPEHLDWIVDLKVSKGTYIRSIARDSGFALGCPAHIAALRRTRVGNIDVSDCVGLDALEEVKGGCALDPVKILDLPFCFIDGDLSKKLDNGQSIKVEDVDYHRYKSTLNNVCACTSGIVDIDAPTSGDQPVSVISQNRLKAIYRTNDDASKLVPETIFQIGVERGYVI